VDKEPPPELPSKHKRFFHPNCRCQVRSKDVAAATRPKD